MEKELISIIIPIYNAEKFIKKSINSILEQTYKNYEVILINDGSIDNSLNILKDIEKDNPNIKVITKKNEGVSKARNLGIEKAKGKYLLFLDADDYMEENMLEDMVNVYKKYKVELVISGFFSEIYDDKKQQPIQSDEIKIEEKYYKNINDIKKDFVKMWDKHILYNIWNKLYLKKIVEEHNIRFPSYDWGEDIQFNREYLLNIQSIYNIGKCYYHYIRGRNVSVTQKYIQNLYDIRIKENREFIEYFEKFGIKKDEYIEFCSRRHLERTLGCIENLFDKKAKIKFKDKYIEAKKIITDKTTREYLKIIKPTSTKIKIMLIPYRTKSVFMTLIMGKAVSEIKSVSPELFNALKNRR